MKKLIIFIFVIACIWWGWTHRTADRDFGSGPGTELVDSDGKYLPEATISNGERVDLTDHLVPDRYTVFVFYADW